MENTQPILTTPVSLIILPASTAGAMPTLQPLTVITTTALNTQVPPVSAATSNATTVNNSSNNNTFTFTTAMNSSTTKTYSGTPPLKPAKKFRQEQEEILRCKRRLEFVGSMGLQGPQPGTVLRRNERERNRVKLINNTFVRLREHLPSNSVKTSKGKAKKLSKVDTLQRAIEYIKGLQQLIDEHDAVDAAFDGGVMAPSLGMQQNSPQSPSLSLHSPGSTGDSENLSDEASVSPDEEDLLDFTSWF